MRKKSIYLIVILSIILCFMGVVKIGASSSENESTYSVVPVLSEHQTKNISSFYDIRWTPGSQEKIGISITNHKSTAQTYVLQVNKAVTNENGMVDYSMANLIPNNEPLKFNFPNEVTVPPKTTSTVYSSFTFPQQDYNGIKIFGVYISEKGIENENGGVSNVVSYALPLVIRGNIDKRPEAKLTFKDVSLKTQNMDYQIKVPVFNEKEVYLKSSKIKVEIFDSKHQMLDRLDDEIDITPDTSFDLLVPLMKEYTSGTYTVKVSVVHGKQTWRHENQIEITKEHAKKINESLPRNKRSLPIITILIGTIFGLSLVLFYMFIKFHSNKSKSNNDNIERK